MLFFRLWSETEFADTAQHWFVDDFYTTAVDDDNFLIYESGKGAYSIGRRHV